ncbi:type II secretion system F family protein [Candidatus Peregrinibacteria bacterium]|jgi:type II secretory pathway component PulF|nr:type II secretion system F family protein [Candidatus Peregrinibacteria bacterium]MBT4148420.1 type II secretion system F family protein [Candidatus Peregrinibacteria bacterium]MBT4366479.1 type II secretion system F family protein [Candidatus Peregrinibacteria bacterium]MBT4456070.1 type II secretion system F family protein [Candidatus Peregrinibacteria bacterium]
MAEKDKQKKVVGKPARKIDFFLKKIARSGKIRNKEIIYGVYDNKGAPLTVRINDFFVDHSGVKIGEKSYFFHMIAVMVDAGIPVVKAIKAYGSRTENERFSRVLNTVAYNSERGMSLSDSMSRFPDVFTEVEIGVVKSGEQVGKLKEMLFKLSSQVGRVHELKMKLWSAAFYPLAVLFTLVFVAVAMLVWVFPTLLNLLNEGGVEFGDLPFVTRLLVHSHEIVTGYWWAMLIGLILVYGAFKLAIVTPYGAKWWDYIKLKIPVLGVLLRRVYVLQFVALIGVLIESGLPVIKALKTTRNAIPNRMFKLKIKDIIQTVNDGGKISDSASSAQFLFPPEVIEMLRVGEKSAALGSVAEKVSEQYQMEIDHSLKRLTSVFEPVLILFVGLFVAILAIAVMAPIFDLSSVVS